MNRKLIVAGGIGLSYILYGLFLTLYPAETEYITPGAPAYIDGATPPQFQIGEL